MTQYNNSVSELPLVIDKCVVVSETQDTIYFSISRIDIFGRKIEHLQNLHNGYDEYNNRDLKIETINGNGPALARLLGWTRDIEIINVRTGEKTIIPAWVYPKDKEWIQL